MAFDVFYQTMAQLCFTLLGLWWLLLQTKYAEWIGVRARRRMITNISLYFLLPGSMSLMALLSSQVHFLWQVAFLVASVLGAIETVVLMRGARQNAPSMALAPVLSWLGFLLFVLVGLVAALAFVPGMLSGLGIAPLGATGILLTLVVVLGVTLAWAYFVQPPTDLPARKAPGVE